MTHTGMDSPTVRTSVQLRAPIPETLAPEIEKRLFFVAREITGFSLTITASEVREVTLFSAQPLDCNSLGRKINDMVDTDVRPLRMTPPSYMWTAPHRRDVPTELFELLESSGAVSSAGVGRVVIGEPLLSLFDYFDRAILALLAQDFTARAYRYPTLIETETLKTAGYLANFPQHLMFVTRLPNDFDAYRAFASEYADTSIDHDVLSLADNVDYCLPPTMCYHTFDQYRGRTLPHGGLEVVTSRGKSFRFEAAYATTLERLWDFTIREIVFLGTRDEVLTARGRFMRQVFNFMEELELSGFCEVANDPFFGGANTAGKILSQRLMDLKYELRLHIAPAKTIAVGSFNYHSETFGRAFEIQRADGGVISSGCVGFGLERLVYAFLCQYGLDSTSWPDAVRTGLGHPKGSV
ncbi:hypothetical protein QM646_05025 [Rhodococcus erythropolis]|nr:hypothetical protein [Rhodococcus erythropolis]